MSIVFVINFACGELCNLRASCGSMFNHTKRLRLKEKYLWHNLTY
uniref:Uncharacterized protein n=1 Tax=Anguilla anguilla TaxID=7936 RepID=A0A0E9T7G6_ANGAN